METAHPSARDTGDARDVQDTRDAPEARDARDARDVQDTRDVRELEQVQLQITGMTCAACANRIEKGLSRLPGVARAHVNLALETAHVEFSPSAVSVADVIRKVEQLGYRAAVKEVREGEKDRRQKEIDRQKRRFALSAVLSLPPVSRR